MLINEMGAEGMCASSRLGEKKQKPSTYWAFSYFCRMGKGHGAGKRNPKQVSVTGGKSEGEWHERKLHDPDTRFMGLWEVFDGFGPDTALAPSPVSRGQSISLRNQIVTRRGWT